MSDTDCPSCGRSKDYCQTQAIRGRDACCMACHAAGRWDNHKVSKEPME